MKLSVTINFFNGEELLYASVKNIRKHTDHISLIFQRNSNWGYPAEEEAYQVIKRLKRNGYIDDYYEYEYSASDFPSINEYKKRLIGYEKAKQFGATHVLLMDADEYYKGDQIEVAKEFIEKNDISATCVRSYFHLHRATYRSKSPDTTNVCFICKLDGSNFEYDQPYPILNVDPTRRIVNRGNGVYLFSEDVIAMQHMNFVRRSFKSKLQNTSSATNTEFIANAKNALENWKFGNKFYFPNKPPYEIIKVPNHFGISVRYR